MSNRNDVSHHPTNISSSQPPQLPILTARNFNIAQSSPFSDRSGLSSEQQRRYYANALSQNDKSAHSRGEQNRNQQSWTPHDLLAYHESRKDLIPQNMPKVLKIEALASIERDIQQAQLEIKQYDDVLKKKKNNSPQGFVQSVPTTSRVGGFNNAQPSPALSRQRTFSFTQTPAEMRGGANSAPVTPRQTKQVDYFSVGVSGSRHPEAFPTQLHASVTSLPTAHIPEREYVSKHTTRHSIAHPIPSPSRFAQQHPHHPQHSSPVPPPLPKPTPLPSQHKHNPNITFDTFLAPHNTGKGEAFRGAENAKKETKKMVATFRNSVEGEVWEEYDAGKEKASLKKALGRFGRRYYNKKG